MARRKYDPTNPIHDRDYSISTMAHFRKKVAELERREKSSHGWERTANEIRRSLLRQIAYMCPAEQLSQCAFELSMETHATLFKLIEPELWRMETLLYEELNRIENGSSEMPLPTLMRVLEGCWWPGKLAVHFLGWESVLRNEDPTEGRAHELIEPLIRVASPRSQREMLNETNTRLDTRLEIPKGMWWYDLFQTLWFIDPSEFTIGRC